MKKIIRDILQTIRLTILYWKEYYFPAPGPDRPDEPEYDAPPTWEEYEDQNENEPDMKNVVIILDNGHGEDTPGKRSPWSACGAPPELPFREYEYTRRLVASISERLNADGYSTEILVPESNDIPLAERVRRINSIVWQAKTRGWHSIMVSIHNNAAGNGREWRKAYGWSVWTTPGQNNSDILAECLWEVANRILPEHGQRTRQDRSDGDNDYEAGFYIIKGANCPAVLVENMFQDCVDEVRWMLTPEGFDALVEIHVEGIKNFIRKMGWE